MLPHSVTTVDGFRGCINLRAINIPEGAQTIGDFGGCASLETLRIPASVKKITAPFNDCPKLTNITWTYLMDNLKMFPAFQANMIEKWKSEGKCTSCGGDFKLIGKICKVCGKKKDY